MRNEPHCRPYPVVLNLTGRTVIIVGAGQVGQRKLHGALAAGARVTIIDPQKLKLAPDVHIEQIQRPYRSGDLAGAHLVFICTNSEGSNAAAAREARQLGIWACRCDRSEQSDFFLPAVLQRGPLTVAVSTSATSPAMSGLLRDQLSGTVDDSWGTAVSLIAAIRRKWLTEPAGVQYNQEVLRNLLNQELIPLISGGQLEDIDQLLLNQFGKGYSLSDLQVDISHEAS